MAKKTKRTRPAHRIYLIVSTRLRPKQTRFDRQQRQTPATRKTPVSLTRAARGENIVPTTVCDTRQRGLCRATTSNNTNHPGATATATAPTVTVPSYQPKTGRRPPPPWRASPEIGCVWCCIDTHRAPGHVLSQNYQRHRMPGGKLKGGLVTSPAAPPDKITSS